MRYAYSLLVMFGIMLFTGIASLHSALAEEDSKRTKVKAVFLYRFFDYVTWPSNSANRKICVVGNNSIIDILKVVQQKQSATGSPFEVEAFNAPEEAKNCSTVYSDSTHAPALLALHHSGMLTVSDMPDFAKAGGMIEITEKSDEVGFIVNLKQAQAANLSISAKLLEISEVLR